MNPSNKWAFVSRPDVIRSPPIPPGFAPGLAVVATDRKARKVERDRDDAFRCPDGIAGRFSTCAHHFGFRPGRAVVGGAADHDVSMLPCFNDVEDREITIPPDFRCVIVHVHRIPERRGGFPFPGTEAQARGGVCGSEIGFAHGGKPNRQQISIRALGDGRAVILADEHGAKSVIGDAHERPWAFKERRACWLSWNERHVLAHVL